MNKIVMRQTIWLSRNAPGRSIAGPCSNPAPRLLQRKFTSPFIIKARGETPVRIGLVDPLTGVYARSRRARWWEPTSQSRISTGKAAFSADRSEVLIEDSANDVGTDAQKTRKLIDRDQMSFIIGEVNSGITIAMTQVTSEKKVLHIVSGGLRPPFRHHANETAVV